MNYFKLTGMIDGVQMAKTVQHVQSIIAAFGTFFYASPKTKRRFARKAAARISELNILSRIKATV